MKHQVINWKWSNTKEGYEGFWSMGQEVPDNLLIVNELSQKTKHAFVEGKNFFFEPLKNTQPKTWERLTSLSEGPYLVRDKAYPSLVSIIANANDLAVFIEPFKAGDDLRNWDEIYQELPEFLHGYYTNFNGMIASFYTYGRPINLPAHVGNWRRVSDYRKEEKLHKKVLRRIESELGDPENIKIFIETEWNDLVMLNTNKKDRKIYVVPQGDFEKFFELNDAANAIDTLCAHVLSGSTEPYYLK